MCFCYLFVVFYCGVSELRRNYKTNSAWRKIFKEKEKLLQERGYPRVSPFDFYRDVFPAGSLQQKIGDGKGNIIAAQVRQLEKKRPAKRRTRKWIVNDSLDMLDKVIGDEFGLIAPISFFGKTYTKDMAHQLFAMAIDIDYVGLQQLKNMLKQFGNGVQLCPSYLVSSGKGVHLYYLLKEPFDLYKNREKLLSELKTQFIQRMWNDTTSIKPDDIDITGIYQGFRCVGSQSKLGVDYIVTAYKLSENRYTLDDIKNSIPNCQLDLSPLCVKPQFDKNETKKKRKISLEEAKEIYPEWYQSKIVEGKPLKKTWICNIALYNWWKQKILTSAKVGGRYFSVMALCAYGLKCGVPERQIEKDAYSFLEHLENLTEDEDNHFTKKDIRDALQALRADNRLLSTMATREWIETNTKVKIQPNKRNGRKQATHLKIARATLEIMNEDLGQVLQGRPVGSGTKKMIIEEWKQQHPDGTPKECMLQTGISKNTVYKWWK